MGLISGDTRLLVFLTVMVSAVVFGPEVIEHLGPVWRAVFPIPPSQVFEASPMWYAIARMILAATFLLFVPGYAFVAALFPRDDSLGLLERGVFSVGSSLALVGLVGIALAETPWGLRVSTIVIAQLGLIGGLLFVTEYRRSRLPDEERFKPVFAISGELRALVGGIPGFGGGNQLLQLAIVGAILLSVFAAAYVIASPLPGERYTEFYVVGPDGTIDGLPDTVEPNESAEVLVGINNHEHRSMTYNLKVQVVDGDGASVVDENTVLLTHSSEHRDLLSIEIESDSPTVTVEFLLFEGEAPMGSADRDSADRYTAIQIQVVDGDE